VFIVGIYLMLKNDWKKSGIKRQCCCREKGSFQDQQKIHEINVLGGLPGCVGGF